ncbi:hypothetical protein [Mycobacterium intracellulare]|uniref:Tryptophanase n=1 Tax=Mycobacterium intracellulare subsp. chimaera TaxID=222805 RepID=A0A7U5MRL7_MYCIT|nr:hypothetical protein [Mycobacterium intracellulare]ASL18398.1 hypothetical protein MYCOZU2_06053 [Mycobacterium intracellulare subsp. chimaera]
MNDWTESELAWQLADQIGPLLADPDRDQLYTTIGAGHSFIAIDKMLQIIVQRHLTVPRELVATVAEWLGAYAHSHDAPRLNELLCVIKGLQQG